MQKIIILILLFLLKGNFSSFLVDIPSLGKIDGTIRKTINGRMFLAYEGVPYAIPPIGEYRFREPLPVKPWPGIWQANTIYKCIQYNQFKLPGEEFVVGDEDCLYLNIYTPNFHKTANLDVIVFIHGGAFMFNYGGQFQPDYILDNNIVFVTFNYRLGPLGFLTTENDLVPGNNGIKDQILALKWIQDNIIYFGGNPNSITITGMSAGGSSVHLHYLIPKSHGLFHKGISQSGTALNPWVFMENGLEKTKKIAKIVGCFKENLTKLINCLKQRPAKQIVNTVKDFLSFLYNPFSPFGIVIDKKWSSDPLLPDHPIKLLKEKKTIDLPWIASQVSSEGLYPAAFFYNDDLLKQIDSNWNELLPYILDYNYTVKANLKKSVAEKIRNYYFKKNQHITKDNFMNLIKMCSDRLFLIGIEKALILQNKAMKSSVYYLYFGYRGTHSKSEIGTKSLKNFGASHADDTSYIFKTAIDTQSTLNDTEISKIMIEIFVSFAKNGKPTAPIEWKPIENNEIVFLNIESPQMVILNTTASLYDHDFWDSLPFEENENILHNTKDEL